MAFYLSFKEVWRNRGRYFLFSLVIALITVLVLFIAALAGGLANANRQFIDKLDADLLIFQENVDLQPTSSRLGQSARPMSAVWKAWPMWARWHLQPPPWCTRWPPIRWMFP